MFMKTILHKTDGELHIWMNGVKKPELIRLELIRLELIRLGRNTNI